MSEEIIAVPLEDELDALFGAYVAIDQARGLVYGLTNDEGLAHWKGFGVVNEEGAKPGPDTLFPIASMSKSFVACAALVARDQGHLSLSDSITDHVPEFSMIGEGAAAESPPTLEMLFSMCGGLTEDNSWVDPFIDMPVQTLLALVSRGIRLSHYPGAAYEYSNLGFALAGLAVGRAVGRTIEEYVREVLLDPLGLDSTCFDNEVRSGAVRATGYHLDPRGHWAPFPPQESAAFAAAGGMMSTVRDLSKWVTWLGAAFRPARRDDPSEILSRSSRRELQRIHVLDAPVVAVGTSGATHAAAEGYALGLRVTADCRRGFIISHAGGLPGFKLFMTWHPVSGIGSVVLTNSHRGDPVALCNDALRRALARHEAPASTVVLWRETVKLRADAERLIREWDDELAAEVLAPNVDFDRPLAERRAEIERLAAEIGPLIEPGARPEIVSVVTPADITWSIPGERGELLCMVHLTPVEPAQVQELVVRAFPASKPRSAIPIDLSSRRSKPEEVYITPMANVRVHDPW